MKGLKIVLWILLHGHGGRKGRGFWIIFWRIISGNNLHCQEEQGDQGTTRGNYQGKWCPQKRIEEQGWELTQAKAKAKELNIRKMTSINARRFSQVNQHATFSNEPFLQIRTTWIQPSWWWIQLATSLCEGFHPIRGRYHERSQNPKERQGIPRSYHLPCFKEDIYLPLLW